MADISPKIEGKASDWTPRQALLAALAECDNWDCVVIMARRHDGKPHGINATPDTITLHGLCAFGMTNDWEDD